MSPTANPFDEYSQLIELVDFAVRKEQEAAAFYRSLLPRLESQKERETIEGLAAMEDDHAHRLELLNVAEAASGVAADVAWPKAIDYETPGEAGPHLSRRQLLEIANGREIAAWKLYSDMASLIPESMMRQLLRNLAAEETRHRELLERLVASEG